MLRSMLLVLALLLFAVADLMAQQIPPLEGNQRVRLSTATTQEVGYVEEITQDSLVIWRAYRLGELRMPLAAIERLEVSRGYPSSGDRALAGTGIGMVIGGVTGAGIGYLSGSDRPCGAGDHLIFCVSFTAAEKAVMGGVIFAAIGAATGAAIGQMTPPAERWEQVVPPLRAGVVPASDGGVAVVLSRPF